LPGAQNPVLVYKELTTSRCCHSAFANVTRLGTPEKVFIGLACSSHNAMWERNHVLLFRASLERLTRGTVNGTKTGMLKLGYGGAPESR